MNKPEIRLATVKDCGLIRSISEHTWPSTYGHIISEKQIDFMLDWMYSDSSLAAQLDKGHQFFIAKVNGKDIGFCSVNEEVEKTELNQPLQHNQSIVFKLNKLYVLPAAQGTGAGKALLQKSIEVAKAEGASSLFLQVNKDNKAYHFYIKNGFVKEGASIFDIGNGYFMDDYIMRLTL